jgi:hypothetical protein
MGDALEKLLDDIFGTMYRLILLVGIGIIFIVPLALWKLGELAISCYNYIMAM